MRVHITPVSKNRKVGNIPVTTTERTSCPTTCPFYDKGCYAKSGPLGMHWRKVSDGERGTDWQGLCDFVGQLPDGQMWRHNQAGDLPHVLGNIDHDMMAHLVVSNTGKRGYTYTHHVLNTHNVKIIERANRQGFTINVSTESKSDAVSAYNQGLPAVCVVPTDHADYAEHDGVKFVTCPAQMRDISCKDCGLCAQSKRKCVVMFKAHGNSKKHVSKLVGSHHQAGVSPALAIASH